MVISNLSCRDPPHVPPGIGRQGPPRGSGAGSTQKSKSAIRLSSGVPRFGTRKGGRSYQSRSQRSNKNRTSSVVSVTDGKPAHLFAVSYLRRRTKKDQEKSAFGARLCVRRSSCPGAAPSGGAITVGSATANERSCFPPIPSVPAATCRALRAFQGLRLRGPATRRPCCLLSLAPSFGYPFVQPWILSEKLLP